VSDTFWQRLFHGVRRIRALPDWSRAVGGDWPDRIMTMSVTDRFHAKQGRSLGRLVQEGNGKRLTVYLKRHYRLPWRQGVLACVRPSPSHSPAFEEWDHLEEAAAAGFPVPRAVAAAEYIGPWFRLQSVLAVEELAGMLALHEAVPLAARRLDGPAFRAWKSGLTEEVARLTARLHRRRWFHKDLYLCHFFIADEDTRRLPEWRGRVSLIDLHRLAKHRWTWAWWQAKDLAQLHYSSGLPDIDEADRECFWQAYRKEIRRRTSVLFRCCIVIRSWKYRRHNLRARPLRAAS
jgi:heptose I phosphotransferase